MYAAEQLPKDKAYAIPEKEHRNQPRRKLKTVERKAMQRKFTLEIVLLSICLCTVLSLNIFLVGRYAEITGIKHEVSSLNQQVEQLKNHREQLLVQIEQSSRLEWIETEAKERLSMKYPDKDHMIYISIDPDQVQQVAKQINIKETDIEQTDGIIPQPVEKIIHKFANVLRI